jgi:hypothetical protein
MEEAVDICDKLADKAKSQSSGLGPQLQGVPSPFSLIISLG